MATKTIDIANKLVTLCREGKNEEAIATLFAPDAVSVEAGATPGMDRAVKGITAIKGKGEWWFSHHEVHSAEVKGPYPHDDRFIVEFRFDITDKDSGKRMMMEEAGLYTVHDGKIIREEFFYDMGA